MHTRRGSVLGMIAALAACCTIHLIILAGGVGAATGILGGWLRSPYLIIGGLLLLTIALGVLVINRTRPGNAGCCPPEEGNMPATVRDEPTSP